MNVELLKERQLAPAVSYIREYRQEHSGPDSPEQYELLLSDEAWMKRFHSGELIFFGCYENEMLLGTAVLDNTGHIIFLCVKKQWQNQDIEKMLFDRILQHCHLKLVRMQITVNAAQQDVHLYHALGLTPYSTKQSISGDIFVPLEYLITASSVHKQITEKPTGIMLVVILGICALAIGLLIVLGVQLQKQITHSKFYVIAKENRDTKTRNSLRKDSASSLSNPVNEEQNVSSPPAEDEQSLDDFNAYVASNLSYTIDEDSYIEQKSESDKEIDFHVLYPQIKSIDQNMEQEAKVNSYIRDCAMNTADQIYLAPSEQAKELFEDTETYNYFCSKVTYKITYMDENLISIVFQDHYFLGSLYAEFYDLRTVNINLNTGQFYLLPEILKTDYNFTEYWLSKMVAKEPDSQVLAELETEQFQKMLSGELGDNRYFTNFFVDDDGLGMSFTYHFRSSDDKRILRGWMSSTCPREEIAAYANDIDFWGLLAL